MAGRPKKLTQTKALQGTSRPCRHDAPVPEVEALTPLAKATPPIWLNKEAKIIFKIKTKQLISLRVLTALDVDMLAMYASSYAQAVEAVKAVSETGAVVDAVNAKGMSVVIPNPYVKIYNDALKNINQIGGQFGFTPATRKSIIEAMPKESDKDDEFGGY